MKRLKVSVECIKEPEPGEIVLIRYMGYEPIDRFTLSELQDLMGQTFPNNPVVSLPNDFVLKKVNKEQFDNFIKEIERLRSEKE